MTPLQQRFFDLVKDRGEVSIADACAYLSLKEEDLRREFATLRHLEKLRGCKKDDLIFITLF